MCSGMNWLMAVFRSIMNVVKEAYNSNHDDADANRKFENEEERVDLMVSIPEVQFTYTC